MHAYSILSAVLIMVLLIGCNSKGEEGIKGGEPLRDDRFAIYLLSDPSINAVAALKQDINSLQLSNTPLITASEIESYYWPMHSIRFVSGKGYLVPAVEEVGAHGLPFVVIVKGKRMYLGAFWNNLSSVSFPAPVILSVFSNIQSLRSELYSIKRAYPSDHHAEGPDPRGSPLIREAIEEAGKIKYEDPDSTLYESMEEIGNISSKE